MDGRSWHLVRTALLLAALSASFAVLRVAEAAPAPAVTAISPVAGPLAGGTAITITGTGFAAGAVVDLGGALATSVVVVSPTSITAVAPAHAPGAVVVTVTNSDGQGGTISGGFTYLGPPPTLTAVSPLNGPTAGATTITLTGTEFGSGTTVTVGGTLATNVSVSSPSSLTAVTPAGVAGVVNVVVTKADGQAATLAAGYTYAQSAPPAVTGVSPATGTHGGGTPVTLTGTGFVAGATVKFGAVAATSVVVAGSTSMTAVTPAGTANALVSVVVTNADSQAGTLASGYRFIDTGSLTALSASPVAGPLEGGQTVTISGTNFNAGATVKVGDATASVSVVTPTSIVVVMPAKTAAGKASLVVTNTDGKSATLKDGYTYQKAPTLAAVTNPMPASTAGDSSLSLSGTGFLEGMVVLIGGRTVSDAVVSGGTKVTFTVPASSPGVAAALVRNPDNQAAVVTAAVLYVSPPTLTAVMPASGDEAGGSEIAIFGDGFTAGATVTVGGKAATVITTESNRMVVKVPAGAPGFVEIVVTVDGLTARKVDGFLYTTAKGKLFGAVAPKGISLAVWGGGTTQALVTSTTATGCAATALAMWVVDAGKFVGYIAGAPAIVNSDWDKKFTTTIPAKTAVIVRCG